ncbi:hypothetical protein [Streptomyces flaveolus]|uniref:hypothetical protein n=1 Tax=Streptomyces flaveolus TaxID=67297 RepID=UPI003702DD49
MAFLFEYAKANDLFKRFHDGVRRYDRITTDERDSRRETLEATVAELHSRADHIVPTARVYAVTRGHRLIFSLHTPMITGGRIRLRPQTSPDLAYGSDIANIGLTITAVVIAAIWYEVRSCWDSARPARGLRPWP